jgi:hypothetical protein
MKRATFEGLDPNNPDDVLNVRGYYAHLERLKTNGHAEPKIGSRAATQNKTFVLQAFNEIAIGSKSVYLVKGVIPRAGLTVIYGPPKCGKSFMTFDLTMHIALGWEYRGRRVKQGAVVYAALEGAEGFKARIEAFRQKWLPETPEPIEFYLIASPMALVADADALIASIRVKLGSTLPAVVTIDTVNRSLAGSESDDKDMAAYLAAASAIQAAFGCAVILIHHSGLTPGRPRGHTSLPAAADAQIAVKRDGVSNIVSTVEFMKDGPEGDQFASRLVPRDVGYDEDGDPISSCVVEAIEEAERPRSSEPAPMILKRKLPDAQRLGWDALIECVADVGQPIPATVASGNQSGVKIEVWRSTLFSRGVLDNGAKNPRQDFKRLHDGLMARRLIGERDGLVWPVLPN